MGSFLSRYLGWWLGTAKAVQPCISRPGPSRLPPGQDPGHVQSVRRAHRARSRRQRNDSPALYRRLARRRFPSRLLQHHFTGLRFSRHHKTSRKTRQCNGRQHRSRRRQVTIQITLPERTGSIYLCVPRPEQPDLCANETGLRPLSRCQKGKRSFDEPQLFDSPETKRRRQSPEPRLSAFQPVWRNGLVPAFVPKPGPLRSSFYHGCNSVGEGH